MKIWFDISNSPHVNMFHKLIDELKQEGHDVIITSRPLANTIELLNQKNIEHTSIGHHYGKSIVRKFIGFPIRVVQLYMHLRKNKPDIAISQSSFHSPLVSFLLKIPCIYTNDNEHAFGNIVAYFFADRFWMPEYMPAAAITRFAFIKKKLRKYPGVKEGMYLWSKYTNRETKSKNESKHVFIRPEPRTAAYYKGGIDFMDNMIIGLQKTCCVTILPRDQWQRTHYSNEKFGNTRVLNKPLGLDKIVEQCSLFIGAGGSMTREIALLGIPSISVYQDTLLGVDKALIQNEMMYYDPDITYDKILNYLDKPFINHSQKRMMKKGKRAYKLLKNEILKYKFYE